MIETHISNLHSLLRNTQTTPQAITQYFLTHKDEITSLSKEEQTRLLHRWLENTETNLAFYQPLRLTVIEHLLSFGIKPTPKDIRDLATSDQENNHHILLRIAKLGWCLGFNFGLISRSAASVIEANPLLFIGCIAPKINAIEFEGNTQTAIKASDDVIQKINFSELTLASDHQLTVAIINRLFLLQAFIPALHWQFDFFNMMRYITTSDADLKSSILVSINRWIEQNTAYDPILTLDTFRSFKIALKILYQQKINAEGAHQPLARILKLRTTPSIPTLKTLAKIRLFADWKTTAALHKAPRSFFNQDELRQLEPLSRLKQAFFPNPNKANPHLQTLINDLKALSTSNNSVKAHHYLVCGIVGGVLGELIGFFMVVGLGVLLRYLFPDTKPFDHYSYEDTNSDNTTDAYLTNPRDTIELPMLLIINFACILLTILITLLLTKCYDEIRSRQRYLELDQNYILSLTNAIYSFYHSELRNNALLGHPVSKLKKLYLAIENESQKNKYTHVKSHTLALIAILKEIAKLNCVSPLPEKFSTAHPLERQRRDAIRALMRLQPDLADTQEIIDNIDFSQTRQSLDDQYPKHLSLVKRRSHNIA